MIINEINEKVTRINAYSVKIGKKVVKDDFTDTKYPNKLQKAVGRCPYCKRYPFWFNDIPLKAYCGGTGENGISNHREWIKVVPKSANPYRKCMR